MRQLIAALGDNIRAAGKNWVARCPVHMDKDLAMTIKQTSDGSVIAHCFACGANGLDLYRTLGLDLDELFGGKQLDKRMAPQSVMAEYRVDKMVIDIFNNSDATKTLADKRRYRIAVARSEGVEDKYDVT